MSTNALPAADFATRPVAPVDMADGAGCKNASAWAGLLEKILDAATPDVAKACADFCMAVIQFNLRQMQDDGDLAQTPRFNKILERVKPLLSGGMTPSPAGAMPKSNYEQLLDWIEILDEVADIYAPEIDRERIDFCAAIIRASIPKMRSEEERSLALKFSGIIEKMTPRHPFDRPAADIAFPEAYGPALSAFGKAAALIPAPAPKILVFGCRTGEDVRALRDNYFHGGVIHGFDGDKEAVESDRRNNADPGIEYFSELCDLDADYDLAVCVSSPDCHFDAFHRALLSIDKRLKQGGLLILQGARHPMDKTFLGGHYEVVALDGPERGFADASSPFASDAQAAAMYRKRSVFERRYGVVWASTENIGDDIQTLAAMHFLRQRGIGTVEFLNRETLSDYKGGPLFVVMNGWYMWKIEKFPPPPTIMPIFISFHCANERLIERNHDYFARHAPIGCRDESTMALFKKHDIPAWFTGCLTLGFDPVTTKAGGCFAVDVNSCDYIPPVVVGADELEGFVHLHHQFPENFDFNDVEQRLRVARELLQLYADARLVVTSRLHCALPCRAMGTPVKFVHSNPADARFAGLHSVLAGASCLDEAREFVPRERIERVLANFKRIEI